MPAPPRALPGKRQRPSNSLVIILSACPRYEWRRPTPSKSHEGEVVAHLAHVVASREGIAQAELSTMVYPPALQAPSIHNGTDTPIAAADRRGHDGCTEIDRGQVVAHL